MNRPLICAFILTLTYCGAVARAAEHFRAQGCPCFLYLTGPADAPPPSDDGAFEVTGLRTVMTMNLLVVGAPQVGAQEGHVGGAAIGVFAMAEGAG